MKNLLFGLLIFMSTFCKSQKHEYLFNNSLNELNGGPALTEMLSCGSTSGSYSTQFITTTQGDCLSSSAFCFGDGGGFQYPNQGVITGNYTINVFFRFSTLGGFARIIDFSNSTADAGIYFLDSCLNFFPNGNVGPCPYFNTNTYYLMTFVRNGGTKVISVYVDGTLFGTYTDTGNDYSMATSTTPIVFFRDDDVVTCENQPGCVKYISVSSNASTASQVAQTWANIGTITQSTNAAPTVTISPTGNLNCLTNTITLSAGSTGTLVWNGGSLNNSNNPATISSPGTYIATATDANGCIDTAMVTITSNTTPPIVTATSNGNLNCSGSPVIITGSSTGNTLVWNGGTLNNEPNPATVTTPGTYTVTATNAATGCFNTASVTITSDVVLPIVTTVSSGNITCFTPSVTLTGTSVGNTMVWNGGTLNNATNPATVAAAGVYTVTATDAVTGCANTASITILSDANLPTVTAVSSGNLTCSSPSVTLTGNSTGNTMVWNGGSLTNALNPATVSAVGTYTVTAIDTATGCSDTATVTVTKSSALDASIGGSTPTSCSGVCDGTATASATGGTQGTGYSYAWNTVPVQTASIATGLCSASYICTVTDVNNCMDTAIVTVSEPDPVVIAPIADVIICIGGNATLMASASGGNTGGYTYSWDAPGNNGFASTSSITVNPVSNTIYIVHATDIGHNCPAAPVIVNVAVNPPLSVIANGSNAICRGASVPLSALATGGNGSSYTYSWMPGAGLNSTTGTNIIATPAATTIYTVTVTDNCGTPAASDTVTVTILSFPTILFKVDVNKGCAPLCVVFTDSSLVSSGTVVTWNWNFGDGSLNSATQNPSHCFTTPGKYSITSTVTSNSGCISTDTNANTITVFTNPAADFNPSPNPATILDPRVTMKNQSSSDVNFWHWNFGDGDSLSPATANPIHTFPNAATGSYITTLIVHNADGCYDTVAHQIFIGPEFTFFIPNAFSPNGDNINDSFFGSGIGIADYDFLIFDHWGNVIFHGKNLNDKWDGKCKAGTEIAQQDVYIWKVKLTDVFDKSHSYIGTVTIVK